MFDMARETKMQGRPLYVAMWCIVAVTCGSVLTYYGILSSNALAFGVFGLVVGFLREYWPNPKD